VAADPQPESTEVVFSGGHLTVSVEHWPGGVRWETVRPYDAAAVLPVTPDGTVLLVRQFRPAVRRTLTEIPAGLLDVDGEDAVTCAARELFEETGYRHQTIEFLGGTYPAPGFSSGYVHLFVATTRAEPEAAPEDGIELVPAPLSAMIEAARAGRVRDAMTTLALLLAAARSER
jgi:ADP-ribose pyrophosphatase